MITALNRDFGVPLTEKEMKCKRKEPRCNACSCSSVFLGRSFSLGLGERSESPSESARIQRFSDGRSPLSALARRAQAEPVEFLGEEHRTSPSGKSEDQVGSFDGWEK